MSQVIPHRRPAEILRGRIWGSWIEIAALLLLLAAPASAQVPGSLDPWFGGDGLVHGGPRQTLGLFGERASLAVAPRGEVLLGDVDASGGAFGGQGFVARLLTGGSLDPAFAGGIARTGFQIVGSVGVSVAVDDRGRVLFAGGDASGGLRDGQGFVLRFNSDGAPDPSFGLGGVARTDFRGGREVGVRVAWARDGGVFLAGFDASGGPHDGQNFVARFTPDGALDPGFGLDGVAHTGFRGFELVGVGLAVADDGKILLAGFDASGGPHNDQNFVARFRTDGVLDPTFGLGGISHSGLEGDGTVGVDLAIGPGGTIFLAARDFSAFSIVPPAEHPDFVARYLPDGALDAGFGVGGIARTGFQGGSTVGLGLAVAGEGTIYLAGLDASGGAHDGENYVAAFRPDGRLDTRFGGDGVAHPGVLGSPILAVSLATQPDGRILLAANDASAGIERDFVARFFGVSTTFSVEIPTLGETGVAALVVLLASLGFLRIRRS